MTDPIYNLDELPEDLRQRAEEQLQGRAVTGPAPDDPQRLIHELQVHQVELQLQNDELRRSQQELQLARNRYFNLFDQAPVGFVMLGGDGRILQANRTIGALLGREPRDLLGRPFAEFAHPDDRDILLARYTAFFRDPRGKNLELRLLPADERLLVGRLAARRMDADSGAEVTSRGDTATLLLSVHDITARHEAEARNKRLEEQLRRAQKLESFGLFAGGIAHEFNNMLMSVVGHCDLAHWDLPPGHEARVQLEHALKAAGHAADICRQLLAYAGQGKHTHRRLDLIRLVDDLLPILQVSVGPRVRLEFVRAEAAVWVDGDTGEIQQIITNLVTNAAEAYGGASGVVHLCIEQRELAAARLAEGAAPHPPAAGRLAVIEVRDEGAGMDPTTCQRIFDPFYSTKFTGRGLGMAVVLGIVRGHGGTILLESKVGSGTTATVALPLRVDTGPTAPAETDSTGAAALAPGATVLLIDDDERVREVGQSMLAGLGLKPLLAVDGPSGVELFRQQHQQIACVLLDLMMPAMDGVEVLAALRAIDPQCRVVIITGYHEHGMASGLGAAHPDAIILKPFRLGDLRNVLASLLPV